MKTLGYAALEAGAALGPYHFDRRELRDDDVRIEILYCGVCHSDLHTARNDWKSTVYPCIPGHEIVGRVSAVGSAVRRFAPGDMVAVGTLVDSCMQCDQCDAGEHQNCRRRGTGTYNGKDRVTGENTLGGYSRVIVVREAFVLRVPAGLDPARAAPLLCAGITTWVPMKVWNVGAGTRVAVAGLGGLGHMAVKFAAALGAEVTVVTTSAAKADAALALGAHRVLLSTDREAMKRAMSSFDLVVDTIPVVHEVGPYLGMLDVDGTMVVVGLVGALPSFHTGLLLGGRRRLSASAVGGIARTQEMLDFCAARSVLADCEIIAMQDINRAFERMERADVRYRFVIDMGTLADAPTA
ncbi:MAG: NAD(P)-dependent alcohol dehydrogenase [Gammaproteobacteria bacterium]